MAERGEIKNRERASQIRDFTGLRYRNKITPTDVDGLIEFGNRAYVVIELKYGESPMKYGQRLALERTVDDWASAGKPSICIVAQHDTRPSEDIDVANCKVVGFRWNGGWHETRSGRNVKEVVDRWLASVGLQDFILQRGNG